MTLIEIIVSAGLVALVGTAMLLGVLAARRQADDAVVVSFVRQAQAGLEAYRARTASYPATAAELGGTDAVIAAAFSYRAEPEGCSADLGTTCRSYGLTFAVKGPVGSLARGTCSGSPQGLLCAE